MQNTIKSITIGTIALMSTLTQVHAQPKIETPYISNAVVQEAAYTKFPSLTNVADKNTFNPNATIGIARLDKGRLITAPTIELKDWAFLNKRSMQGFAIISPASLIKNIPEVSMYGRDSDNKLDEIRMTASDLRMDYVLVYGMGQDAQWGSFAGKSLMETGFITDTYAPSPRGGAKALLVDTYTGNVFGTLTSDEIEYGIGDLTDKVQDLVKRLSSDDSANKV